MHSSISFKALAILALTVSVQAAQEDFVGPAKGRLSRYWNCCKPSCAWADKGAFKQTPVLSCNVDDKPLFDAQAGTGCNGGESHECSSAAPWAVSDELSYGFVGAYLKGGEESTWCCGCYEMTFSNEKLKGKKMIVQAANTNYDDVNKNIFNLAIPGGNYTYSPGCDVQWKHLGSPELRNVKFDNVKDCDKLPKSFQAGCRWRFDWLLDTDNNEVEYKRVTCPKELTDISKCERQDDQTFDKQSPALSPKGMSVSARMSSFVGMALGAWSFFG